MPSPETTSLQADSVLYAVLWDYDNTMAFTEDTALRSACKLTNTEVLPPDQPWDEADFLNRFRGVNYREILQIICNERDFQLDEGRIEELAFREREKAIEALSRGLRPVPNIAPVQSQLQEGGFVQAVVSSSALPRLEACLKKAAQNQIFQVGENVYSAETSLTPPQSKPAPAIYIHACEQQGLAPEECLAVEDSVGGIRSATSAGIAYRVGFVGALPCDEMDSTAKALFEAGAQYVIDDIALLPQIISSIQAGESGYLQLGFSAQAWGFIED